MLFVRTSCLLIKGSSEFVATGSVSPDNRFERRGLVVVSASSFSGVTGSAFRTRFFVGAFAGSSGTFAVCDSSVSGCCAFTGADSGSDSGFPFFARVERVRENAKPLSSSSYAIKHVSQPDILLDPALCARAVRPSWSHPSVSANVHFFDRVRDAPFVFPFRVGFAVFVAAVSCPSCDALVAVVSDFTRFAGGPSSSSSKRCRVVLRRLLLACVRFIPRSCNGERVKTAVIGCLNWLRRVVAWCFQQMSRLMRLGGYE